MPERIQRKRTKGFRLPENTISVTQPGKWGNPFKLYTTGYGVDRNEITITPDKILRVYEEWLDSQIRHGRLNLAEIRGFDLACFCKEGNPCHGDVLIRKANE